MSGAYATPEGTCRYRDRFPKLREVGHFRCQEHVPVAGEAWLSSIGLGTYLGETDIQADISYTEAICEALRSGINVLDTAINYRNQHSERNIGSALRQLFQSNEIQRDELLVCTKAGFLPFDGEVPHDPQGYIIEEYINKGLMQPSEIAGGMHCIAPSYLENQIERSRQNLGLETIDVFYLHNPESQLNANVPPAQFRRRLQDAFSTLEKAVQDGKIRFYGCATWNAFRLSPQQREAMSLYDVQAVARSVAGEGHHCRFLQLPFNLMMPEAYTLRNQAWEDESLSALEAAVRAGLVVMGSATLYQGRLTQGLPEVIHKKLGTSNDSECSIQFARCAPGMATSLIGMGRKEHVQSNLKAAFRSITPREQWQSLFQ